MNRSRSSAATCLALSVLLFASTSHGLEARECVATADAAQRLRLAGSLLAAQEQLVACADASCPSVVRVACADWLREVKRSIPTVVLAAKEATTRCGSDGGHSETRDLFDVDVRLDGKLLTQQLDGRAIPVDPGGHVFRFELPGSSSVAHEETIQVREGEKLREVGVTLTRGAPEPCASSPRSSTPVAAYVAAGASLVSFGAFAFFAASSHAKYQDLMRTCAPSCSSDARAPVLVEQDLADVSLGVGIVAAAVATWLFVTAGSTHATLQPVGRGAELRVSF